MRIARVAIVKGPSRAHRTAPASIANETTSVSKTFGRYNAKARHRVVTPPTSRAGHGCQRELNQEILDCIAAVMIRGPWLSDPSYALVGRLLWTLKDFVNPYFYGLADGMDALLWPNAVGCQRFYRKFQPDPM